MSLSFLPVAFVLFVAVVGIMTIGLWFGRKPISGTCGGLNTMLGKQGCSICGNNPAKCID